MPGRAIVPTVFINGRFLTQPVTGVQRYARELVRALDALLLDRLADRGQPRVVLVHPPDAAEVPALRAVSRVGVGRLSGHAWEQLELPYYSRGGILVNLCNTAPLFKRRQVLTIHDVGIYRTPDAYTWRFRAWYDLLWRVLASTSTPILTVSEFSKAELIETLGVHADRVTKVTESGEHINRVHADAAILDRHGLRARPFVLAVSSLNPNKNFGAVTRAIELLGDTAFDFAIAGRAHPRVFGAARLDASPRVRHVGAVTDAELRALYENAACFVYPSLYEGFGLPPVEAMACGCPVLAAQAASLPEVCGDAARYCDPRSPEDIARKLVEIMTDDRLRDELCLRGRQRASLFSWRAAALQHWEVIHGLCAPIEPQTADSPS